METIFVPAGLWMGKKHCSIVTGCWIIKNDLNYQQKIKQDSTKEHYGTRRRKDT